MYFNVLIQYFVNFLGNEKKDFLIYIQRFIYNLLIQLL